MEVRGEGGCVGGRVSSATALAQAQRDPGKVFEHGKCTESCKYYKTVRIEYRTLRELVLLGKSIFSE